MREAGDTLQQLTFVALRLVGVIGHHKIDWRKDKSGSDDYTITYIAARNTAYVVWRNADKVEAAHGMHPGADGKAILADVPPETVAASLKDSKEGKTYVFAR